MLYDKKEIEFLNSYWENVSNRNISDRKYEFALLTNNELQITTKLLNWFEQQSGETLNHKNFHLTIHKYKVGDFFKKHIDAVERGSKNRKYVVGFHINDNYKGGDYILYNPYFVIDKTPGVPYMFTSDREHEITKVTEGIRKSALIFINHEDLIIKKNLL